MVKNRNYEEYLIEKLTDPELALLYLKEALADEDERLFYIALKNVAKARGVKIKDLAERTNLNRENLYRVLSNRGNPQFRSIKPILIELGFNLTLEAIRK